MKKLLVSVGLVSFLFGSVAFAAGSIYVLQLANGSVMQVKDTLLGDKEVYRMIDGKNTCYIAYTKNAVNTQAGVAISCVK